MIFSSIPKVVANSTREMKDRKTIEDVNIIKSEIESRLKNFADNDFG